LIENVLDFSRIERGRKQYDWEPTDLRSLAETTQKLMEPYAAERGLTLRLKAGEEGKMEAMADGKSLQQALVNLIDNALKHSPRGGTVTVGLDRGGGRAGAGFRLWVEDEGPGIPAAEQERIFERFYRCGSELRRQTQGAGIGLSIVKHIVEAHGGAVRVRSAPGQGSRFTMELPEAEREVDLGHA
jgi:signal transduction histidine kinase